MKTPSLENEGNRKDLILESLGYVQSDTFKLDYSHPGRSINSTDDLLQMQNEIEERIKAQFNEKLINFLMMNCLNASQIYVLKDYRDGAIYISFRAKVNKNNLSPWGVSPLRRAFSVWKQKK